MFTRISTDVTAATVNNLVFLIEAGGGTFERVPQDDGTEMVVAHFPGDPPPEEVPAAGAEFPWMPIARGELGVQEGHNLRITEYFTTTTLGAQPDSVPWCSAFANFCIRRSGVAGTNSALARSWLKWGEDADDFAPGCIVVLSRGDPTKGHVGFYVGRDGADRIQLLGGNQHDSVNISSFDVRTVLAKKIPVDAAVTGDAPPTAVPPPANAGAINLDSVPSGRRAIAQHVIDAFANAGFGTSQQATALANAIAESRLDPNAHATSNEDSVGLFQLNRRGGLGTGRSVAELLDPDTNIAIIVAEAKKVADFVNAPSLRAAVDAFVRKIERPKDQEGEMAKRLEIAERLLA